MRDSPVTDSVVLVCAVLASLASGVLVAHGACLAMFGLFRMHARQAAINCGQFEGAFTQLMPGSRAKAIVAALSDGEEIELPRLYQEEQFNRGFIYECSPVHFVLSPSIDPSGKSCVSSPACSEVQTILRSSRPVSV